jgi:hypothetical protein
MPIDFYRIENKYIREAAQKTGAMFFKHINPNVTVYINQLPDTVNGKFKLPQKAAEIIYESAMKCKEIS